MDIFEGKSASPMLIAEMQEPFDSPDYIYELKLDGERCLAYLDNNGAILQNKRKFILNARFPELTEINQRVKHRCILDGEIAILVDGKPDFSEVKRRSVITNKFKIDMAINKYPASFTAFDILYDQDTPVTGLPLMERKKLLAKVVQENAQFAVSRYIEEKGIEFYKLAEQNELEGVVAKRKDSAYLMGKRTKDWIKFKRLFDDDFVVSGYIPKEDGTASVVLGQYTENGLVYKGRVSLGVSGIDLRTIMSQSRSSCPFSQLPNGNSDAVWIQPKLVCTVQWMPRQNDALNQPVFKGLRDDKAPEDCIDIKTE